MKFRQNQQLHIDYLKQYDFKGLFRDLRSPDQLWTPAWRWIPLVGYIIELAFGKQSKLSFYESMYFYGFHRFQLGLFGRSNFFKHYHMLRRPYVVPLATLAQLDDLSLTYPPDLFYEDDKLNNSC